MLGIARKGFVMKDKQADLRPPRDPQGHHVELPDRPVVRCPSSTPLLSSTHKTQMSAVLKTRTKRVCPEEEHMPAGIISKHLMAIYSWPKAWDNVEAHYKGNRILITRESGVGSGGGGGGF